MRLCWGERGKEEALKTAEVVRWRCYMDWKNIQMTVTVPEWWLSVTAVPLSLPAIWFVPSPTPLVSSISSIMMIMLAFDLTISKITDNISLDFTDQDLIVNWNSTGKRNKKKPNQFSESQLLHFSSGLFWFVSCFLAVLCFIIVHRCASEFGRYVKVAKWIFVQRPRRREQRAAF